MIHSARPIVTPVANIVFCCFVLLDLKSGDGRTDGQHVRKQLSLPAVTLDQFLFQFSTFHKTKQISIVAGGTVSLAKWIIMTPVLLKFKL